MSKKKRKEFRSFECCNYQDGLRDSYITMTKSMLLNEKWLNLTYSSQILYIYMRLWSYGKVETPFSYSLAIKQKIVKSKSTFKKSIDELIENGFIEITRISKKPGVGTLYRFIDNWQKK